MTEKLLIQIGLKRLLGLKKRLIMGFPMLRLCLVSCINMVMQLVKIIQ